MAMTKILGFTGEAEILGGLHGVTFHDGGLTISGLDLDGAYAVMEALSKKTLMGVRLEPGDRPGAEPVDARREAYREKQAEGFKGSYEDFLDLIHAQPGEKKAVKEAQPKTELAPKVFAGEKESDRAAAAVNDEILKTIREKEKAAKSAAKTEEVKAEVKPEAPTGRVETSQPEAGGDDIPEKVVGSKRFIEVLEWVMQANGLTTKDVDPIIAKLEAVKDRIPVVQRVRDLRDKVTSNLAAWAENGG